MTERLYSFVTGPGRQTIHWEERKPLDWKTFVAWLGLDSPADHKECGGYVVAELRETKGHLGDPECIGLHRNKKGIVSRSVLTLDADSAGPGFLTDVALVLDGTAWAAYTTWSHTPEAPRWRLLVPLSRNVTPEDYRLLVRALTHDLGATQFDPGSSEPERFMYRPSTQGGEYLSQVAEGEPLDPEGWLARATELGLDRPEPRTQEYLGDETYEELTYDQKQQADMFVQGQVEYWRKVWDNAKDWPEKHYPEGKGWERLAADCAWAFARMAVCPWAGLDADGADLLYRDVVPDVVQEALRNDRNEKSTDGLLEKAGEFPFRAPPWEISEFDVWHTDGPGLLEGLDEYDPSQVDSDLQLGKRVARQYLVGKYLAWGRTGWAKWDGRRWDIFVSEDEVVGDVREALLHIRNLEIERANAELERRLAQGGQDDKALQQHSKQLKKLTRLTRADTLNNARRLARPDLSVRLEEFDGPETADLLNCANGVVDLRTGDLLSHDPEFKFTKISETAYYPGAAHSDWDACLRAVPEDVQDWVQRKFGQAATGHSPPDDLVLFIRGGGENGKTTFLMGVRAALGDYYTTVPDKVLEGNASDHPTELMTLKGARLAVIEELPGGDWLTGTRLKKALGSETGMTARYTRQDNVTWTPTHALVATTNHLIHVTDVDYGTTRRLCDLNFPYTFSGDLRDPGLKGRMKRGEDGQHEAALAWLVRGARLSYEQILESDHMPFRVRADTDAWLRVSNPVEEFMDFALEYSEEYSVLSSEVYAAYRGWSQENGRRPLSDQKFWERAQKSSLFSLPDVKKTLTREYGQLHSPAPPERSGSHRVVTYVRWSEEGFEANIRSPRSRGF